MAKAITVPELRSMSAAEIQALPHALRIESEGELIGFLIGHRKPDPEEVRRVLARIDEAAARRTPEETRGLEILLGEREPD